MKIMDLWKCYEWKNPYVSIGLIGLYLCDKRGSNDNEWVNLIKHKNALPSLQCLNVDWSSRCASINSDANSWIRGEVLDSVNFPQMTMETYALPSSTSFGSAIGWVDAAGSYLRPGCYVNSTRQLHCCPVTASTYGASPVILLDSGQSWLNSPSTYGIELEWNANVRRQTIFGKGLISSSDSSDMRTITTSYVKWEPFAWHDSVNQDVYYAKSGGKIWAVRFYNRLLSAEEIAHNASIDEQLFS